MHDQDQKTLSGIPLLADLGELERVIERDKPAAMVIIPADNPTGQHMRHADIPHAKPVALDVSHTQHATPMHHVRRAEIGQAVQKHNAAPMTDAEVSDLQKTIAHATE